MSSTVLYLFIGIIGFIFSCIVLYFIIKSAVKEAIIESGNHRSQIASSPNAPIKHEDNLYTPAQKELKAKYERSEITLEEYQRLWNNL